MPATSTSTTSPDFAVDARGDPDAAESFELVRGYHPGADRAGLVKVFSRRDVELRMAEPVPERPFVHAGQAGDVPQRRRGRDAASSPPDHDRDLSFVVELGRFGRPAQADPVANEGVGSAHEDAGVSRPLRSISVFLVAVTVVDPHTDDFLWLRDGREEDDLVERVVRRIARRSLRGAAQAVLLEQVAQARILGPKPVA
jgi:hypothetical protein